MSDLQRRMHDALQECLNEDPNGKGIITKYVVVCEVADRDVAQTWFIYRTSEDLPAWAALGLADGVAAQFRNDLVNAPSEGVEE